MYNFFVLGQVPGTPIVITFTMWLEMAGLIISLLAYIHVHSSYRFINKAVRHNVGSALRPLLV